MSNDLEYTLGLDIGPYETQQAAASRANKKFVSEQQALFGALDRLTAVQQTRQTASLAGHKQEIILQREILGLRQTIGNIEGTTLAKLEAQILLEQKQLQLEKMIAQQRTAGAAGVGGGAGGLAGSVRDVVPAAKAADTALGKVGNTLGKLVQVGNVLKTALTTLGVGLLAPFASDAIARAITGVSKAEEEALEKIGTLSTQVADKRIEYMRAQLTDEQRYQLLLQQQESLLNRISENRQSTSADVVRLKEDELALLVSQKEAAEALSKIEEARAQEAEERFKNQQMHREFIDKAKKQDAEYAQKRMDDEWNLWFDDQEKKEKRLDELAEKNQKIAGLQLKGIENLNDAEKVQLDILTGKLTKRQAEVEAAALLARGVENLTELERQRLAALTNQTKEFDKQTKAVEKIVSGIAGIRGFAQFEGASEDELRELLRRNQQALAANERKRAGMGAIVGGDVGRSMEAARLQAENMNLRRELEFRAKLERDLRLGGEDGARRNFQGDPLLFDDILARLTGQRTAQDETNDLLKDIRRTSVATAEALKNLKPAPDGG